MNEDDKNGGNEEKVPVLKGLQEVGKMFSNDPEQMVISDDEVLEKMKKDLEKRISKCTDKNEKTELNKELLILQILILQREKIDKEAAVILNEGNAFGLDLENDKVKEKKKKERDRKQKDLIDKLNELGISNLDIEIKPPEEPSTRAKGGYERQPRIR